MLKQRVITALFLIPLVILASYYLNNQYFAVFFAIFVCVGAWEWAAISGFSSLMGRRIYVLLVIALLAGCYYYRTSSLSTLIVLAALIWWNLALILILIYQFRRRLIIRSSLLKAGVGLWVLVPAWLSFVILHASGTDGLLAVVFLLVLIWVADSAAFFTGRRWGKTKLSSNVSPGKSWEGVLGAVLATLLIALGYSYLVGMRGMRILLFLTICLVTVMGSVLGDLLESALKRSGDVKDSGKSIPGHGGVMDRIDSLTAAGPIFLTGFWLLKEFP